MKSWITKDGRKINIRSQMGNKHLLNTIKMIHDNADRHANIESAFDDKGGCWKWNEYYQNFMNSCPEFPFLLREAMRRKLIS